MTPERDPAGVAEFVERLELRLRYTDKVYAGYMKGGKKFVFAKVLFEANGQVHDLVASHVMTLPKEFRDDAFDLLFHIDVWRAIWSDEVERRRPRWDEAFAFENEVTFPKRSVDRLLSMGRGTRA